MSERELRYLWVLVSLNATESVLDVLLQGHPSWDYLQEVQTLLENVQRSLMVRWHARGSAEGKFWRVLRMWGAREWGAGKVTKGGRRCHVT